MRNTERNSTRANDMEHRGTSADIRPATLHRLRVDRAKRVGMFTERMDISPAFAAMILKDFAPPGTNRSISMPKMLQLAQQMTSGKWNPNSHQGLAFRTDGVLADGQHRLSACVQSGVTIGTLVTYGQPADVFTVLDQGTQRSAAHLLQFAGLNVPNINNAAATARFLVMLSRTNDGAFFSDQRKNFDKVDIVPFMHQHANDVVVAVRLARNITTAVARKLPVTPIAAALFLIGQVNPQERVGVFVEALAHGAGLEQENPILHMRNALISDTAAQGYRTTDDRNRAIAAAIVNTWNSWTAKRRMRSFRTLAFNRREGMPEVRG